MHGLHVQPGRGFHRLPGQDGEGHQRVYLPHLGHQRVQDGLVPGVAQAVGPADEHPGAAAVPLAVEYLLVQSHLFTAGDVDGVVARGAFKEGLAQPGAQLCVPGQRGEAPAQGLVVADLDEIACLAVGYEAGYAAHAGGYRGQAVRRALR